ncbi:hypothetical protein Taro_011113 [Colocasia esculenta]|uniref:Uncharacterized protein n=1 Tax=Colocasia esculenta TaxID=4460 RepID=A0A843U592_COLES|nr:hypothetical protein [Colocasia esculenta]
MHPSSSLQSPRRRRPRSANVLHKPRKRITIGRMPQRGRELRRKISNQSTMQTQGTNLHKPPKLLSSKLTTEHRQQRARGRRVPAKRGRNGAALRPEQLKPRPSERDGAGRVSTVPTARRQKCMLLSELSRDRGGRRFLIQNATVTSVAFRRRWLEASRTQPRAFDSQEGEGCYTLSVLSPPSQPPSPRRVLPLPLSTIAPTPSRPSLSRHRPNPTSKRRAAAGFFSALWSRTLLCSARQTLCCASSSGAAQWEATEQRLHGFSNGSRQQRSRGGFSPLLASPPPFWVPSSPLRRPLLVGSCPVRRGGTANLVLEQILSALIKFVDLKLQHQHNFVSSQHVHLWNTVKDELRKNWLCKRCQTLSAKLRCVWSTFSCVALTLKILYQLSTECAHVFREYLLEATTEASVAYNKVV